MIPGVNGLVACTRTSIIGWAAEVLGDSRLRLKNTLKRNVNASAVPWLQRFTFGLRIWDSRSRPSLGVVFVRSPNVSRDHHTGAAGCAIVKAGAWRDHLECEKSNPMSDRLVTLATYRYAQKAEMACAFLEQEGVSAFVADGNMVTTDWLLGSAVGYAKLQVPDSQAEKASEILRKYPKLLDNAQPVVPEGDELDRCLACDTVIPEDSENCPSCGWSYRNDATSTSDDPLETDNS